MDRSESYLSIPLATKVPHTLTACPKTLPRAGQSISGGGFRRLSRPEMPKCMASRSVGSWTLTDMVVLSCVSRLHRRSPRTIPEVQLLNLRPLCC
jgi:hypothetical protein